MKPQFSHTLFSSFYLWFEAKLLSDSVSAYATDQSNVFEYTDFIEVPSSHYGYQGKFRQLTADSSVSKMNSGVFIDGGFVTGSNPDIYIDYNNGRVIVPSASGTGLTISANNTIKEVNLYVTEDDEEELIITSDFVDSAATSTTNLFSKTSKRDDKTYILPACFLQYVKEEGEPISFGGEEDTQTRIRAIVLAYDNFTLDGIFSAFANTRSSCFKRIPFEDYPYGQFDSVKSFPYSYSSFSSAYTPSSYIERVQTSKITSPEIVNKLDKNLIVGYIDFDISTWRYPRA